MRQYLRMLKPNCFEDLIAMLALYRPGPLGSGMVDEFIKRKHGTVTIEYPLAMTLSALRASSRAAAAENLAFSVSSFRRILKSALVI